MNVYEWAEESVSIQKNKMFFFQMNDINDTVSATEMPLVYPSSNDTRYEMPLSATSTIEENELLMVWYVSSNHRHDQ